MTSTKVYSGAAIAGAVAGMRSMAAPAVVSKLKDAGLVGAENPVVKILNSPVTSAVTTALAVGEAIADKLPFMPDRTITGSIVVRAISGGLSGAAICLSKRKPVLWGVLLGGAAAVGATYAAFALRKQVTRKLNLPDTLVALAEDALVATAGYSALRALQSAEATA